jgi:hypothetical protein
MLMVTWSLDIYTSSTEGIPEVGFEPTLESILSALPLPIGLFRLKTEAEGFEPSGPFGPAVFKTATLNHSVTLPKNWGIGIRTRNEGLEVLCDIHFTIPQEIY